MPTPQPESAAHATAKRATLPQLVTALRELLGAELTAYIAGVNDTRELRQWVEGSGNVSPELQARLRISYQVALMITDADSRTVTQSWFQGLNPQLDDRSPARLLREGDPAVTGPEVLRAASAFLIGG